MCVLQIGWSNKSKFDLAELTCCILNFTVNSLYDARHEKTDPKVFVVVMSKEGWARVAISILLWV